MNESRRILKRIFIAIVYLAIFTGLGTGAYFLFRPTPVPLSSLIPTIYPIEVIWSRAFSVGPGLYSVAAKIQNPNTNFGASNFSYTFYLYDENNNLIDAPAGESYIGPASQNILFWGALTWRKHR